ncbi:MAG: hypothetical protein ACYDA8_10325 [Deferrisomatales bacterium]
MQALVLAILTALLLGLAPARAELVPEQYTRISQCVLVRERESLVGQKVQVTGKFVEGSRFCYELRKAGINTRDYFCFALGEPCLLRLYLKKDHPQQEHFLALRKGDRVTAYGVFDYMGIDYNFMILDGISIRPPRDGNR